MKHYHLRIIGMNCAGCVNRVEKALRDVSGVAAATVDLMSESARVETADGAPVQTDALIAAVRNAGYDAEVLTSGADLAERIADDSEQTEKLRRHRRALLYALCLAGPVVLLDHLGSMIWGHDARGLFICRVLQSTLLALLAISEAGAPILLGGLRALRHRTGNMDLLITMGVGVAFVSSIYGAFIARDDAFLHFHAAAMILGLVCVGRYLEGRAKGRASAAITALAKRVPKTALVRRDGRLMNLPVEEIVVGELVSAPAHATIPVDGVVVEGVAAVDESLMTGEPLPARRGIGDQVLGGTTVNEGLLLIRATDLGSRSALGRIVQLVAQAQSGRTQMQRLADRIAAVFTPLVIAVAAAVFAGWLVVGGGAELASATRAAVAVLVVACPCALGLATPTVVTVASGLAALRGILVRDAAMLEAMGRVNVVVWDKTGTLTSGTPAVRAVAAAPGHDQRSVLRWAAEAEQFSSHPLAQAIFRQAKRDGLDLAEPSSLESAPGSGVTATISGSRVVVGSLRFLQASGIDIAALQQQADALRRAGDTVVAVAIDGRPGGVIALTDAIRRSAAAAVRRLTNLGIRSEMLTGDEEPTARSVAAQVGIETLGAGVDPAGKLARIRELRQSGRRVAMVGDGVNDAAALAAADVGIAFATGADVAGESAGINLVGSTPHLVADAVELARAGVRVIRQNLFWAFFYNVLMIPLAATGKLPPGAAAGAMMISSLTVVLNALRLPRIIASSQRSAGQTANESLPRPL